MRVAGACSGLRSLTAILALAVAIAYLSGRKMPYCILLVLMAGAGRHHGELPARIRNRFDHDLSQFGARNGRRGTFTRRKGW